MRGTDPLWAIFGYVLLVGNLIFFFMGLFTHNIAQVIVNGIAVIGLGIFLTHWHERRAR